MNFWNSVGLHTRPLYQHSFFIPPMKKITHPGQREKRKRTKKELEYNDFFKESTLNSNPKKFGEAKKKLKRAKF